MAAARDTAWPPGDDPLVPVKWRVQASLLAWAEQEAPRRGMSANRLVNLALEVLRDALPPVPDLGETAAAAAPLLAQQVEALDRLHGA